ncbi:MAG TPA: hypothetical protein VFN11_00905 [Ktedonobacterales bacterium]|nr:hypothetical protein [Ktedonobacterales bacterium]
MIRPRGRRPAIWVRRPAQDATVRVRRLPLLKGMARFPQALLCAFALAVLATALLMNQPAQVHAAASARFYGIAGEGRTAALATDTPTDTPTNTPTPTPTDTPAATPTSTPTNTPTATPTPGGSPNVLDVSAAATAAGWPQQYSNWCGVATVALIADYLNPGAPVSQSAILGALNNPANQSQWSYPAPGPSYWGPYVPTDISGDFGTDPRSLADGLTMATGSLYHAKVDVAGAWDTTVHIVHDLLVSRQPISVFVDHGMHSLIVSGVDATGDPLANPRSITAIHVWDPGGGVNGVGIQAHMAEVVPLSLWLSGTIPWSGSSYLKYPYAANVYQGRALDPDPAVGPYAFVPAKYNHLWVGHNVYLSPLASSAAASLSPDWELNQYGVLIAGLPGGAWPNIPDGYTGDTVPMPTNPPPPPPPVQPPKPAPKLKPPPPPRPTPTVRPKLTATPLPTATLVPTAAPVVSTPVVCEPVGCALAALWNDPASAFMAVLLLLLTLVWLPPAVLVARLHVRRARQANEAAQMKASMVAMLATDDVSSPDAITVDDVASAADEVVDSPEAAVVAEAGESPSPEPDAPTGPTADVGASAADATGATDTAAEEGEAGADRADPVDGDA